MKQAIKKAVIEALVKLYPEHKDIDFTVEYAPENTGADFASNVAMILAKKVGKKPGEVAEEIIDELIMPSGGQWSLGQNPVVAGPGFINFNASPYVWQNYLKNVLKQGDKYGQSDFGKGKKVNVESVSANPTGPLTVGHGRGAIIGQVLANVLASQGFKVEKDYYYNDAGLQMKKLGESVKLRAGEILGEQPKFSDELYQGEYIRAIAQDYIDQNNLSQTHDDLGKYAEFASGKIFKEILNTLENLGVDFDNFIKETDQDTNSVLAALEKAGVVYEKDGAKWLKLEDAPQDRVLVRSTGEPTYRLPDIAYHAKKTQSYDKAIDIFGSDHIAQFPDIKYGVEKLGGNSERIEVIINQFVTLKGGPSAPLGTSKKMSTRAASYVTLDELVAEVGVDVAKFFFALSAAKTHMKFDLDLARDTSDKNPLYKIQYAHARIQSILEKAKEKGVILEGAQATDRISKDKDSIASLQNDIELSLIREVSKFPELLLEISETYAIHLISHYLLGLADQFNSFYEKIRIISDDDEQTQARVGLITGVQTVLANGLELLGIKPLKKM